MRIAIDIDGVLTNVEQFVLDYMSKFCVENGIDYHVGKSTYGGNETFGLNKEQGDAFWDKYLIYYAENEKARPFASEVIKKFKEDGHEIYILTARWTSNRDDEVGRRMREIVKNWLKESDIVYDKLIFSKAAKEKKSQEVLDYEVDVMIEDSPSNIMDLSKIIPVICYDTQYNRECVGKNIIRCYSWYDILKTIREKKVVDNF